MQFLTMLSCQFVELTPVEGTDTTIKTTMGVYLMSTVAVGEQCGTDVYQTDDPFITSSRSFLGISICFGALAGVLIMLECLFCNVCGLGCVEGFAYLLAWTTGAATFVFYGSAVCEGGEYETFLKENADLAVLYTEYLNQGGADVLGANSAYEGCTYSDASHFMTVAIFCYLSCGVILCWYVIESTTLLEYCAATGYQRGFLDRLGTNDLRMPLLQNYCKLIFCFCRPFPSIYWQLK
jgi:hypothetical protein